MLRELIEKQTDTVTVNSQKHATDRVQTVSVYDIVRLSKSQHSTKLRSTRVAETGVQYLYVIN